MKVLWKDIGESSDDKDVYLVILDDRNYAVGQLVVTPTKQKDGTMKDVESVQGPSYFGCLGCAVRFIAKNRADHKCKDLRDWLTHFESTLNELEAVFLGN